MEEQDAQKDLQPTTGRDETERKTQKKMERASRRRSSSAGNEKMGRDSDRQKQMEGHCSRGQGSQRAVLPMEEERRRSVKSVKDQDQCNSWITVHDTTSHAFLVCVKYGNVFLKK